MRLAAASGPLCALVALGFLLRVWGIGFGLPHEYIRPDETTLMYRSLSICAGELNPHFFNYPSLQFYFLAIVVAICYVAGWASGQFVDVVDFQRQFFADPSDLYVAGRLLTVAFGTGAIALVYRIGACVQDRRTGLAAAFFLAVSFLHVRDSHFLTVDVPATFWLVAALAFLCRLTSTGAGKWGVLAGACMGLATSTKYNAALFMPAALCAAIMAPTGGSPETSSRRVRLDNWKLVLWTGSSAIVAFVAGSPYSLLDSTAFLRDLNIERLMFDVGRGFDPGPGWLYHLQVSLWHGIGWPLLLTSGAGCALLAYRRRPLDLVLLSALVVYLGVAGGGQSVFVRYMIPVLPILCVAAGVAVARLADGLERRWWSMSVIAVLLALPTLWDTVQHNRLLSRADTRNLATAWIEGNVSAGARIALVGSEYGYPRLRPTMGWKRERLADLEAAGARAGRLRAQLRHGTMIDEPSYNLIEVRHDNPQNLRSVWEAHSAGTLVDSSVRWVVTQEHPLPFSRVPTALQESLQQAALEVASFDPFTAVDTEPQYDPIDAFYTPLAGFAAVARPGPLLRIYKLNRRRPPDGQ